MFQFIELPAELIIYPTAVRPYYLYCWRGVLNSYLNKNASCAAKFARLNYLYGGLNT